MKHEQANIERDEEGRIVRHMTRPRKHEQADIEREEGEADEA
jgi:hypothetical protein